MSAAFHTRLVWSGAGRLGGEDPSTFSRDLDVSFGELSLPMSAAPEYRGDAARANPEQLFVAALSACQALTYLFLAARNQVGVQSYADAAEGVLELAEGKMRMTRVTLRPHIVIADARCEARARELVDKAHAGCFIYNSVTATVTIEPRIDVASRDEAAPASVTGLDPETESTMATLTRARG
jgi:organic hydroperoxide reductase OsmC/OhrA